MFLIDFSKEKCKSASAEVLGHKAVLLYWHGTLFLFYLTAVSCLETIIRTPFFIFLLYLTCFCAFWIGHPNQNRLVSLLFQIESDGKRQFNLSWQEKHTGGTNNTDSRFGNECNAAIKTIGNTCVWEVKTPVVKNGYSIILLPSNEDFSE